MITAKRSKCTKGQHEQRFIRTTGRRRLEHSVLASCTYGPCTALRKCPLLDCSSSPWHTCDRASQCIQSDKTPLPVVRSFGGRRCCSWVQSTHHSIGTHLRTSKDSKHNLQIDTTQRVRNERVATGESSSHLSCPCIDRWNCTCRPTCTSRCTPCYLKATRVTTCAARVTAAHGWTCCVR